MNLIVFIHKNDDETSNQHQHLPVLTSIGWAIAHKSSHKLYVHTQHTHARVCTYTHTRTYLTLIWSLKFLPDGNLNYINIAGFVFTTTPN